MTTTPKSGNLLIVDDDFMNLDMLSRRLERSGYAVTSADSGEQALAFLRERPFDLVLLDNMMPGLSGLQVLEQIRARFTATELPVVMVTAQNESQNIVTALGQGANDYITKPVDFAVALARIRTHLSHKAAEAALRESEQRYALAARGANDGLWDWNLTTNEIYYSPRWKAMLGFEEEEIANHPDEWLSRVHPDDLERVKAQFAAHCGGQSPGFESEHRMRHKDGTYRWMRSRGVAVRGAGGEPQRMAGSLTDITESKVADPLTGLPNRLFFVQKLEQLLERLREQPERGFAVLFLDLDRFKVINDSLGHACGDQLLCAIAARLNTCLRASESTPFDTIARFGGDEFGIVLENVRSIHDATRIADRIHRELKAPFRLEGRSIFASASVGIALSGPGNDTPEDLLRNADTAMYHAKAHGKACSEVFDSTMLTSAIARLSLEEDLRRAIEKHELLVYYQPKVFLSTGAVMEFEALVRWRHPARGLVGPSEFIPIAEETGLIVPIGQWVLEESCRQIAAWQKEFPSEPPLSVSVNLSWKQFAQPDLVEQIARALLAAGLDAHSLRLEITESVIMEDPETAMAVLQRLRDMNIGLKVDDFGTGYSSLTYLHRFPFDTIKIDRSFVANLQADEEGASIVQAIVDLARALRMNVVAEGIETAEQATRLKSFGCSYGQGYYFAAPLPPGQAETFLRGNRQSESAPQVEDLRAPHDFKDLLKAGAGKAGDSGYTVS